MRSRWLVLLAALAVGAAACGGGGSHVAAKKKPAVTTTTPGPPIAPLTGLPDPSGQSLTRPALSIKIENTPETRPQTGLDAADVVYEEITEAGITRFVAVFNSTIPPMAGPVRSGRIMDPDLVAPLAGIFAYSGGINETVQAIAATPGVNVIVDTGSDPALIRDKTKAAPHNLYAVTNLLLARGGKPVPPAPLFQYLPAGQPFAGTGVSSFTVHFDDLYRPTFTYDAASNTWKRSIGFAPFTDTDGGGVQDAPTNVIVQFVGCCLNSPEGGNYQTVGNGDVDVFSAGREVQGHWARSTNTQPIQYTDVNGTPIKLTPGKTWVELYPSVFEGQAVQTTANPAATIAPTTTTTTRPKKKH